MNVEYNLDIVRSFCADFYKVTKLQNGLFDTECNPLIVYPPENSKLCALIHRTAEGNLRCFQSGIKGLREAKTSCERIYTYRCHAGLIEMSFPIYFESEVAGYFVFGQLLDGSEGERQNIRARCAGLMDDPQLWERTIDELTATDKGFVYAAARMMETCLQSTLIENMMKIRKDAVWEKIDRFISDNLHKKMQLTDIARGVFVSVSTVSHKTKEVTGQSVCELILKRRLARARDYLAHTDYKISEVAALVGIEDYNYFSRVFRGVYGYSPKEYRRSLKGAGRATPA